MLVDSIILEGQRMARVTVEDCVDKVPNRFELVLLAAHRARRSPTARRSRSTPRTTRTRSSRCARSPRRPIPPDDMREGLIHSIQKNVEVDEPEAGAAPMLPVDRRPALGRDDQSTDTVGRRDHRGAAAARHGEPDADRAVRQRRRQRRRSAERAEPATWLASRRAMRVRAGASAACLRLARRAWSADVGASRDARGVA